MTRAGQGVAAGLLLALSLVAAPAQAQSKKELVAKVVQLQQGGVDALARQLAGQTAGNMLQLAGQAMAQVPADKRDAVGKDVQAEVKKFHDDIEPMLRDKAAKLAPATLGPVLDEKFSEDELKQVIAWLESPAAKKYQQVSPELEAALAQKLVADTRPLIEPKLKALQQSLQKKLGLPAEAPAAPAASGSKAPAKK